MTTPPQAKNPVCWFELYVDNMERAKRFYAQVFNANFVDMSSPQMQLWRFDFNKNAYGATGALAKMEGIKPGGGALVYFACASCAKTQQAAAAAGGKVIKPEWSIGEYGNIAIVEDSEGNCIGLHSD